MTNLILVLDVANKKERKQTACSYSGQILSPLESIYGSLIRINPSDFGEGQNFAIFKGKTFSSFYRKLYHKHFPSSSIEVLEPKNYVSYLLEHYEPINVFHTLIAGSITQIRCPVCRIEVEVDSKKFFNFWR